MAIAGDPQRNLEFYTGVLGLRFVKETVDFDDPHIPPERVHETTAVYEDLGADVDERIYEGMGHGVNRDELDAGRRLVDGMLG